MRILIAKPGSTGAIAHPLPAVEDILNALPELEISRAVQPASSEILRDNPLLARLIEVDTKAPRRGLMSGETLRAPRRQLRRLRASAFDFVLELQGSLKSEVIARLSGARRIFGFSRNGLRKPASRILLSKSVLVRIIVVLSKKMYFWLMRALIDRRSDCHRRAFSTWICIPTGVVQAFLTFSPECSKTEDRQQCPSYLWSPINIA